MTFEDLGFKRPDYIVNHYGIKVYVGTEGEDDWCVEIPNWIAKAKCRDFDNDNNIVLYLVSEEKAFVVARKYTELANKMKG